MIINKLLKKILICGIILNFSINIFINKVHSADIQLEINGTVMNNLPVAPIILNDSVLVPAREVFEEIGAVVDYKDDTKEIFIGYEDTIILLKIGETTSSVNENIVTMSTPPQIINGKTSIPARFIAESLGFEVNWIEQERKVVINSNKPEVIQNNMQNNSTVDLDKSGVIESGDYLLTGIKNLTMDSIEGGNFYIQSTSPMSRIDKFLEDNTLIVDIYNSKLNLQNNIYTVNNPYIEEIRLEENIIDGQDVTRVIFQLNELKSYNVSLSTDRTNLSVNFIGNSILDINHNYKDEVESINITFENFPNIDLYKQNDNIIIQANNITTPVTLNSNFENISISQVDETTYRIYYNNINNLEPKLYKNGNTINIELLPSPEETNNINNPDNMYDTVYQTIFNDKYNRRLLIKKPSELNMSVNNLYTNDNYMAKKYTVTFPNNYSNYFGVGTLEVNDENIKSITLNTNESNQTELLIDTNRILAFVITEDANNIYIDYRLPKEIYPKIVVIDPGHGGDDPGATGIYEVEKDFTLAVSKNLLNLIERDNLVKVYLTRTTDVYPNFEDRYGLGNEVGDLFISIHGNSAYPNQNASGTEVYYSLKNNNYVNGLSSSAFADIILNNLINELSFIDRGVKTANHYVTQHGIIPAVLAEIGFLSNPSEAYTLSTPEYKEKAALAIYKSIIEVFNYYTPTR